MAEPEIAVLLRTCPHTSIPAIPANDQLAEALDDSETDTKKSWSLNVDIVVQRIPYMTMPYDENWALFQNADYIVLQNNSYLIWN